MTIVHHIKSSEAFIAVISKRFLEEEDRFKECQMADKLDKTMYAVIMEKDINWDHFKQFKWRKIYYRTESPESIMKDIKNDLAIIKHIRSIGDTGKTETD